MLFWLLTSLAFLATADNGASTHAPAFLLRAVLVVAIFIGARAHIDAAPPMPLRLAMGLGTLATAWGLVFSPNRLLGMQAAANAALVILSYWSFSSAPKKLSTRVLDAACLIGMAQSIWALSQRFSGVDRAHGGFFSPNDLAAFLAPCGIIALSALQEAQERKRRTAALICVLLTALGIWASGSRGGWGALLLGGLVMYLPRPRSKAWTAGITLGVGVLGGLSYLLLRERWDNHLDPYAYSRLDIWAASLRVFVQHPFGVGLGGYADALRIEGVPLPGWVHYPRLANHAHNECLQSLVECGFLGGIASLAAPVAFVIARRHDGTRRDWATLVAFVVPALTSATLHLPPVAFLAAAWAANATHGLTVPRAHQEKFSRGLMIASVLAVLLSLPGTLSNLGMSYAATARDRGRLDEAIAWADVSEALNPESVGAAMLRASLHFQKKQDVQGTAERLASLTDRFPQSPDPPMRAAQLLASISKRPDQWGVTGRLYAVAAERDPHNALRWYETGVTFQRAGDDVAAEESFTRALHEEPNCARALAAMAKRLEARGDAQAAARLRKAVQDSVDQSVHFSGYMAELLSLP